jgi:hypothetical protein
MTSPTYAQNKKNIYKWRQNETNMRRQLDINKLYKRRHDAWKKVKFEFLAILII